MVVDPAHFRSQPGCDILKRSLDRNGCRQVQSELEQSTAQQRAVVAGDLRDHVRELIHSRNGNYVLQVFIRVAPGFESQWIIDGMMGFASELAAHSFGCRVFQRLLERCSGAQTDPLVNEILGMYPGPVPFPDPAAAQQSLFHLCAGEYSNFVIQMVLERGTDLQRMKVAEVASLFMQHLVVADYGASVVTQALRNCPAQGKAILACALYNIFTVPPLCDWWLERVAKHRHACETLDLLQKLNLPAFAFHQQSLRQRLSHSWYVKTLKSSKKQKNQKMKEKANDKHERGRGNVQVDGGAPPTSLQAT